MALDTYTSDSSLLQLGAVSSSSEESYSDWVSDSGEDEQTKGARVTATEAIRSRKDGHHIDGSLPPLVGVSSSSSEESESDSDSDPGVGDQLTGARVTAEEVTSREDGHQSEGSLPPLVDVSCLVLIRRVRIGLGLGPRCGRPADRGESHG